MAIKYEENPLTTIYATLAERIFSGDGIGDIVQKASTIRFDGIDRGDPRDVPMVDAYSPTVGLVFSGFEVRPHASSTHVEIELLYELVIETAELRLPFGLFPLLWGVVRAISQSDDDLGLSYVQRVWMEGEADATLTEDDSTQRGWASIAGVRVLAVFDRAEIKSFGVGEVG